MNNKRRYITFLFMLSAFLCLCVVLTAQTFRGGIGGTITDAQQAVVPNASVQATEDSTGQSRQTVSSSAGTFVFQDLPQGTYTVTIQASGFDTLKGGKGRCLCRLRAQPPVDACHSAAVTNARSFCKRSELGYRLGHPEHRNPGAWDRGRAAERKRFHPVGRAGARLHGLFRQRNQQQLVMLLAAPPPLRIAPCQRIHCWRDRGRWRSARRACSRPSRWLRESVRLARCWT